MGVGAFVIGLSQISSFLSLVVSFHYSFNVCGIVTMHHLFLHVIEFIFELNITLIMQHVIN